MSRNKLILLEKIAKNILICLIGKRFKDLSKIGRILDKYQPTNLSSYLFKIR
jgi:hypothetical protein